MFFHGSSAVERGGFAYVLSNEDHPAAMMISNVKKIPIGKKHASKIGPVNSEFSDHDYLFFPLRTI